MLEFFLAGYVLSAVVSQTALDFFILVMAGYWLAMVLRHREQYKSWGFYKTGVEWAMFGYLGAVIVSWLINWGGKIDYLSGLQKLNWILHIFLLQFIFTKARFSVTGLCKLLAVGTLIPSIYAIFTYIYGVNFITGRFSDRLLGALNSATYYAHANAVIFVFGIALLGFMWKKVSTFWRILLVSCYSILGVSIYLTFTRGIWLSIVMSSLIMVAFHNLKLFKKFAGILITAVLLGFVISSTFRERIFHAFDTSVNYERVGLLKVNYEMWKDYPIFGVGYGGNAARVTEYWQKLNLPGAPLESHAHDQYLNVLSSTGLFGFVFFLAVWILFLRISWNMIAQAKSDGKKNEYIILFACTWAQLEFAIACLTDVSFEYAKIRALIVIVWALVLALRINYQSKDSLVR